MNKRMQSTTPMTYLYGSSHAHSFACWMAGSCSCSIKLFTSKLCDIVRKSEGESIKNSAAISTSTMFVRRCSRFLPIFLLPLSVFLCVRVSVCVSLRRIQLN